MYSFHQKTVPASHQNQPSEKPKMTTERSTRRKNLKCSKRSSTQQLVDHQASKTGIPINYNSIQQVKMSFFKNSTAKCKHFSPPPPPFPKSASVELTADSPVHPLKWHSVQEHKVLDRNVLFFLSIKVS